MSYGKEVLLHSPNFSLAFQQMANFVAIAKTRNSAEVLDELIQQCFVVLPQEPFTSVADITEGIYVIFGIKLGEKNVSLSIKRLFEKQNLVALPGGQIGLSPTVRNNLEIRISEAKNLEEDVKKTWLSQVFSKDSTLDPEKLWATLKAYLSQAFRRHGIQVIALLDSTAEVAKDEVDSLSQTLEAVIKKKFDWKHYNSVHDAISSFFVKVREDRNRAEYISQLADGAFNYYSLTVSPEVCEKLRGKLNPLMLFLDTNFLFGILNLHFNPQLDVSTELIQVIKKFKLPFKLYYHDATSHETSSTISCIGEELSKKKWSTQISRAVVRSNVFSGIELRYHQKNAEQRIEVEDFMAPYLHWETFLKDQGIDIYRITSTEERLRRRANLEVDYKDFLKKTGREKPYDAIQHDMAVLETVRSLRLNIKNTLDAGAIFVTCDYQLCRFDWESSRKEGIPRSTVLPTHLWQILRPFVTESQEFDKAFAETFALPEFTLTRGGAMKAASRMLSILASYRDFPEETAVKMLANDLLLTDLQNKKTDEEFHKTVDSAFAKEIASLSEQTNVLKKQLVKETDDKEVLNKSVFAMQQQLQEMKKVLADSIEASKQKESQPITMAEEPIKQEPEKTHTKRDGCIIAFLITIVFELSIHSILRWSWFLEHTNSYGLQAGFSFMILFVTLGFMVPSWRKVCWIVGGFAMLAAIIQLLGGPTKT